MNENYVAISELSSIDSFSNNDEIIVTRCDNTTNESVYISYKANLGNFITHLSSAIAKHAAENFYLPVSDYLSTNYNKIYNEHKQLISDYDNLSAQFYNISVDENNREISGIVPHYNWLSNEISTFRVETNTRLNILENHLCSEVSNFISSASCQISIFENTLSNNLCAWLSNSIKQLYTWVNDNFVNLYSNQTITGQKTFTQDISGTALSAKWI